MWFCLTIYIQVDLSSTQAEHSQHLVGVLSSQETFIVPPFRLCAARVNVAAMCAWSTFHGICRPLKCVDTFTDSIINISFLQIFRCLWKGLFGMFILKDLTKWMNTTYIDGFADFRIPYYLHLFERRDMRAVWLSVIWWLHRKAEGLESDLRAKIGQKWHFIRSWSARS